LEELIALGARKFVACGGATLASSLIERARALGMPLYQGFGLSECTTVVSLNSAENNRPGSAGIPLPHVSVEISTDGEVVVHSNALMSGYLGQETRKITRYPTGDLGYMDNDGFLYITGRKDSAFALSSGRNISPEWVEGGLLASNAVRQALVYGAGLPFPSALIVPDADWLREKGQEMAKGKKTIKELLSAPALRELLIKELGLSMSSLPEYATVKEFIFIDTPFTKEAGEMTPSHALNRKMILDKYCGPPSETAGSQEPI